MTLTFLMAIKKLIGLHNYQRISDKDNYEYLVKHFITPLNSQIK